MSPLLERDAVLLALSLLAAAAAVQILPASSERLRQQLGLWLLVAVAAVLAVAIAGRWIRESQGPFLTMYDVLLSNVFSLSFVFVLVCWHMEEFRSTARVVIPLLFLLCAWLATVPAAAVPLPETFDNPWLWIHVLAGKVFLGLCMVSAAAAALRLTAAKRQPAAGTESIWSAYFVAFIAHTIMLVAGAAWAHTAWGRFWSWDSLEISTLVTWLLIGATLHARVTFKAMPQRLALSLVATSFVLAVLTFFGLPFLSIGPHKGFV